MDKIVELMAQQTEELAAKFSLRNTTSEEEKLECLGLLERSIEAHPELLHNLVVEELHGNYMSRYEELTVKMTDAEKSVFTSEFYESLVLASMKIMTELKNLHTSS